ncbi:MAG: hypothetical protein EX271_08755 [Acidimicrobiales bacterium]|nr:hypothetical protein [Hyphomonadaceae bacterium]RZV41097.1 MAG: hypothetical protein EX271_08755 [Acidimicrobiales bacterium]
MSFFFLFFIIAYCIPLVLRGWKSLTVWALLILVLAVYMLTKGSGPQVEGAAILAFLGWMIVAGGVFGTLIRALILYFRPRRDVPRMVYVLAALLFCSPFVWFVHLLGQA